MRRIHFEVYNRLVIALSSCEAGYMALLETAKEAIWASWFLNDLGYREKTDAVLVYADNKSVIDLTVNPLFHKRTKYIEIRWHWIREVVELKKIRISYFSTKGMLADGLTKPLAAPENAEPRVERYIR